jgi:pyruvate dehydrogenase (quinone)
LHLWHCPWITAKLLQPGRRRQVKAEQALHLAESLAHGTPNRGKIALTVLSDTVRELV